MTLQVSVFIATSLDGFIARPDGSIDFLESAGKALASEDYGYADFTKTIDCLVMGRNSFEKVLSFPTWPYQDKRVIVMSQSLKNIPEALQSKVELSSQSPQDLVKHCKNEGLKRIYLDGGRLIQSFLQEQLVTDIIVTQLPILIGQGIPLFGKLTQDIKLEHLKTKSYASGFVQSNYKVLSSS